jgi:hypothetical protein
MSRNQLQRLLAAFALALTASGAAYADDSSMSMWTGDSYAYFNDLDYHPGGFNTARAAQANEQVAAVRLRNNAVHGHAPVLERLSARGTVKSPFRDDTGD